MNSKRRAELQRKLSMGAVPRPPADLSDRIKADIPQFLQTDVERARFSGSVAFSMRVAASILLLITTAFVTLRVLEPAKQESTNFAVAKPVLVPAVTHRSAPVATVATAARPQPLGEEVRLDISQEVAVPSSVPPATPAAAGRVAQAQHADADTNAAGERDQPASNYTGSQTFAFDARQEVRQEVHAEPVAVADAQTGFAPQVEEFTAPAPALDEEASTAAKVEQLEKKTEVAEAPAQTRLNRRRAAPAPVPPPAAAMAPPPPSVAESITVTASAPSIVVGTAFGSELTLRQKSKVFGISLDPRVFLDMKAVLEDGKLPTATSVNVDALVNYFAGPPDRSPRRVNLEVEASPAPVESEGDHAVLRFTIDTPRIAVAPRESTPPAAADARVEIEIDPKAVANFHRIGGDINFGPESMLLHNLSVTGLYDLELHPHLNATQHVATVRLRYRSVTDGKSHMITKVVHGSDLARDWERASRRHRLASLGAVWSESLRGAGARQDVAKRAEELATQEPKDTRARELAKAATATAAGGRR
jgi:hypothetical protein